VLTPNFIVVKCHDQSHVFTCGRLLFIHLQQSHPTVAKLKSFPNVQCSDNHKLNSPIVSKMSLYERFWFRKVMSYDTIGNKLELFIV